MNSQIISRSQRRQIQLTYERALIAMDEQAENHLLAHELLSECIIQDLATPIYINALLNNLQLPERLPASPVRPWISALRSWKFFRAANRQPVQDAIRFGLRALYRYPTDLLILCRLAEVCQAADMWAAAECYLRQALAINSDNQRAIQLLAESLLQQARFEEALYYWQQLPPDMDLDRQVREIIDCLQTNLPSASSTGIATSTDARKTWPREIEENPTSAELYLELSQQLIQENRWDEATDLLNHGLAAIGSSPELLDRLETVRLESYRHRHQIAENLHQINPQLLGPETLHDLQSELDRTELQVCERRARRYPTDYRYQLQLAICLRRTANYRAALKQLARIPENDQTATEASLEKGKCHQYLHQFAEAATEYGRVIDSPEDQLERCIYEQALYHGGILTAAMGNMQQAQQWLSRLLDISPDHLDARDRLDKIMSIGDNRGDDLPATGSSECDS